jgi:hypothetical protein
MDDMEESEMNSEESMDGITSADDAEDLDEDLEDEASMEDDNESDFLDKPDNLSGDDTEYSRS